MKKKFAAIGAAIGILLGAAFLAYAITNLFTTVSETSNFSKKTIFQMDLSTGLQAGELAPGDSASVAPTIYNDATEEMYVFLVVKQPTYEDAGIYTYDEASDWVKVSDTGETQVYAYAGTEMTSLFPGETTEALTDQITMNEIGNAAYFQIEDINVTITGYAIGTEDISANPAEAWEQCKEIGAIA